MEAAEKGFDAADVRVRRWGNGAEGKKRREIR